MSESVRASSMSKEKPSKRKLSNQPQLTVEQKARQTIQTARKQLDLAIEQLDQKIKKRIEVNQSQILHAYRNHVERITRELKSIKENFDWHQKRFSADKALAALGRQSTLFRQEAMRLHNQLEEALGEVDVYKRKSEILEKELKDANERMKVFMHSNKILDAEKTKLVLQTARKEKQMFEIESRLHSQQKQPETPANQHKIKERANLNIKIPQNTTHSNINIKQWLNNTSSIRTKSPNPNLNQNSKNYKIFYNERINTLNTPKHKSFKESSTRTRTRNMTSSMLQQRNSGNVLEVQTERDKRYGRDKGFDQLECFRELTYWIKQARTHTIQNSHPILQFNSKNIDEFLKSDEDILKLCKRIFTNLTITKDLEPSLTNSRQNPSPSKTKTLTQLSAQLMKQFNIQGLISDTKEEPQNPMHLNSNQLQFIYTKSKMKTEVNQSSDTRLQKLALERTNKLRKMNEQFKRKTVGSKGLLSAFYLSARGHRKDIKTEPK